MPEKFTIIRDSREQKGSGWNFRASQYCLGQIIQKLPTGDYSLKGLEEKFTIERKGSVAEFAGNLFEERFTEELKRLEFFEHPFIFLEFEFKDIFSWPYRSGLSKFTIRKIKTTPASLLKRIMELNIQYKTKIMFVGNKGQEAALSLMKRIYDRYKT